jgi:hypothetical protein
VRASSSSSYITYCTYVMYCSSSSSVEKYHPDVPVLHTSTSDKSQERAAGRSRHQSSKVRTDGRIACIFGRLLLAASLEDKMTVCPPYQYLPCPTVLYVFEAPMTYDPLSPICHLFYKSARQRLPNVFLGHGHTRPHSLVPFSTNGVQ